jgi:hypothetical protein
MAGFLTLKIWVPEVLAGTLACATFAAFALRTSKRSSVFISAKLVLRCKPKDQPQKGF